MNVSTTPVSRRACGVAARTVAQEHSHVPYLWQIGSPDVLIYLDVSLAALQRRRHPRWTQAMLDALIRKYGNPPASQNEPPCP